MKILFILLLIPFTINLHGQWSQIGSDIPSGGNTVSLNGSGNIVAIGNEDYCVVDSCVGNTIIYELVGDTWVQLGNEIIGGEADGLFGCSVSLSKDSLVVAIGSKQNCANAEYSGSVEVYEYISGSWTQKGNTIYGETANDKSGRSVSINANGTIIAIGSPYNDGNGDDSGQVRIFEFDGSDWVLMGNPIYGESEGDLFGRIVSINSSGTFLAVGATNNDGMDTTNSCRGHVRAFEYDGTDWVQIGNDIEGETEGDFSPSSLCISPIDSVVAIGSVYNNYNETEGTFRGHARVFKLIDNTWIQLGNDIDGYGSSDALGSSVSLNNNGSVLAIGAPYFNINDLSLNYCGQVQVLEYNGTDWEIIGHDIFGNADYEGLGYSVSLNSDGTVIAAGMTIENIRVFGDLSNVPEAEKSNLLIYPNPSSGLIEIDITLFDKVEVWDIQGRFILSSRNSGIDISSLQNGIYYLKVIAGSKVYIKKIIKI